MYWDLQREVYPGRLAVADGASGAGRGAFEELGADLGMAPADAEGASDDPAPE